MRILIYNDNLGILEYLHDLVKIADIDINIDETFDRNEFFNLYNKYNYDVVCVEYFDEIWNDLLNEIIKLNPEQKIVLLGEKYSCSQINNCLICQKNHNINIMITPILDTEIMHLFSNNFICEEYEKSELEFNLLKINKIINFKYESAYVNMDTYTFIFSNVNENKRIMILTDLIFELKTRDIKYAVTEDLNVKIEF